MDRGRRLGSSWWIYTEPTGPLLGRLFHAHLRPDDSLVDLLSNALGILAPALTVAGAGAAPTLAAAAAGTAPAVPPVALACALLGATLRLSQNRDKSHDLFAFRIEESIDSRRKQIVTFTGAVSDRRYMPPIGLPYLSTPFDLLLGFHEGSARDSKLVTKLKLGARNYGRGVLDFLKLHPVAWPFIPFMRARNNPFAIKRIAGVYRRAPIPP